MKTKATIGGTAHFSIQDHFKAIERVRQGLKEAILACPGPSKASGIKQVSTDPHCCVVSSKSLMCNNWSASTYIFSVQYEALAALVSKGEPQTVIKRLLTALRQGSVKGRDQHNQASFGSCRQCS
jgi:hypothetical protein